jgi:outer membrane protein assembly factor BamA
MAYFSKKVLLVFFCLQALFSAAQTDTSRLRRPLRSSSLFPLPIVFYTPETRWAGGASLFSTFRFAQQPDAARPSQIQLGFGYTQNKQLLIYLPFQFFPGDQSLQVYGEIGYFRYIYPFYGIGNTTELTDREDYHANFPRFRATVFKRFIKYQSLGIRYWFDDFRITQTEQGGLLTNGNISGRGGSFLSGAGLVYNIDTRDNLFWPTRGMYAEAEYFLNNEVLGSNFNFRRASIDVAHYQALTKKTVFANNFNLVSMHGEIPFQQLALLGGAKKMRGYIEGQLRDRHLWLLQTEFRAKIRGRFGAVAFAGAGAVSPKLDDLLTQEVHFTYGAGIRFRMSKKEDINIRLDFAGNEKGEFAPYLTVKEAF